MPDAAGGHPATSPLALPVVATPTDDQLVASARSGDGFAASRLWHRHEGAATAAAAATPGSADVEFVVEAAAARFSAAILADDAPVGAMRPHVLASVREAAAAADGRGGSGIGPAPALLAPAEWYRAELPAGLDDGEAIAVAFTSLGSAAQEAVWLAEIDGLPSVELAAELALTPAETEGLVATAHEGIRNAWLRQVAATAPAGGDCDGVLAELGAPGTGGRRIPARVRAHVDECDGCRAAALPSADLAHRLVGLVPLLVLGGASGTAFLEATRAGSSAAVLGPIPAVPRDRAAFAVALGASAGAAGVTAGASGAASAAATPASGGAGTAAANVARTAGRLPRTALAATSAALAAAAAAVVIVAAVSGGVPGLRSLDSSVTADAGSADISAPPAAGAPPEIISTDIPADPGPTPDGQDPSDPPTTTAPDAAPDTATPPSGADSPEADDPGTTPDAAPGPQPEPGSPPAPTPDDGVSTPVAGPAQPGAGLSFTVGDPGDAGWRPLTVTGAPGTSFTVFDDGNVLIQGVLDASGTANFAVRGSIKGLTIGYSSSSLTAGGAGSVDPSGAKSSDTTPPGSERRADRIG
ncbi:hypothetical protein [Agromyces sp. GXQ0307]|uniref:hypothetical protein n=1 Tax=Agromyces sp. GXQ0307 TaxID=3377835 RepID=UPI00383AFDDB